MTMRLFMHRRMEYASWIAALKVVLLTSILALQFHHSLCPHQLDTSLKFDTQQLRQILLLLLLLKTVALPSTLYISHQRNTNLFHAFKVSPSVFLAENTMKMFAGHCPLATRNISRNRAFFILHRRRARERRFAQLPPPSRHSLRDIKFCFCTHSLARNRQINYLFSFYQKQFLTAKNGFKTTHATVCYQRHHF